jgi:hypothetical protein
MGEQIGLRPTLLVSVLGMSVARLPSTPPSAALEEQPASVAADTRAQDGTGRPTVIGASSEGCKS